MPRRWTELDSDEYRLPHGLRRVGYDADERRYYFRDGDGRAWQGEPGNEYGVLTPVRPEPPVTIPRRPPPPYSEEPVDEPRPRGSTSAFRSFTDILGSHQITSASPSAPKRSHTINIPSTASLKRSSTTAASFIRSQGRRFTDSGHSGESSHDDSQRPPRVTNHRRIASASMTIRRSATTATTYIRDKMKPRVDPVDGDPQPPRRTAGSEGRAAESKLEGEKGDNPGQQGSGE